MPQPFICNENVVLEILIIGFETKSAVTIDGFSQDMHSLISKTIFLINSLNVCFQNNAESHSEIMQHVYFVCFGVLLLFVLLFVQIKIIIYSKSFKHTWILNYLTWR